MRLTFNNNLEFYSIMFGNVILIKFNFFIICYLFIYNLLIMKQQIIYLVGSTNYQLMSSTLSPQRNCTRVLFYNMLFEKILILKSAKLVINKYLIFGKNLKFHFKMHQTV